jgi:hypothetical protein
MQDHPLIVSLRLEHRFQMKAAWINQKRGIKVFPITLSYSRLPITLGPMTNTGFEEFVNGLPLEALNANCVPSCWGA